MLGTTFWKSPSAGHPSRTARRPRAIYVSYDGALDPLGASQVLPYVRGLAARGVEFTLISFEKPRLWRDELHREAAQEALASAGIRWHPLRYHRRPRLPGTLLDLARGSRAIRRELRGGRGQLVHARGDVAMVMARWARLPRHVSLLYDMRGFFSDERVESGSWRRGSLVDRAVRAAEGRNLLRADGLVVLTRRAVRLLAERHPSLPPHRVIPTCVDDAVFRPGQGDRTPDFGLVYSGSVGTWYMLKEMVDFSTVASQVVKGRTLWLTPQPEAVRRAGALQDGAEFRSLAPHEVPGWLRRARAAFFFIRPTPAKSASCPTKLAEALATGLPVVANRGVGDVDEELEAARVGVLVEGFTKLDYEHAAARLVALLRDPETSVRCRALATRHYGIDIGVARYWSLYSTLLGLVGPGERAPTVGLGEG